MWPAYRIPYLYYLELGQLYVSFDVLKNNAYMGKLLFYCSSKRDISSQIQMQEQYL